MNELKNPDFHAQAAWVGWWCGARNPPDMMAHMSVAVWGQLRKFYHIFPTPFADKQQRMHEKMMAKQTPSPVNKPKRVKRQRSEHIK